MAKLGFVKAGIAGFAGQVTGTLMGKAVNNIEAAMEAIADPGNFMSKALEAVQAKIEKVAGLDKMPFAFNNEQFGGSLSAKHAFENGMKKEAPAHKRGMSLPPNVPRQKL